MNAVLELGLPPLVLHSEEIDTAAGGPADLPLVDFEPFVKLLHAFLVAPGQRCTKMFAACTISG